MLDVSKLGLPEDVRPRWSDLGVAVCSGLPRPGVPGCHSNSGGCRYKWGMAEGKICEPAVEAMARAIPGFLPSQPIPQPALVLSPDAQALEAELRASMSAKEGKGT